MPNYLEAPGSLLTDQVSSGFLNQRNMIVFVEVNGRRIRLENVENLMINYTINTETRNFIGTKVAQHFVTSASIDGTMTLETTHGVWQSLVDLHQNAGIMPDIKLHVIQPRRPVIQPAGNNTTGVAADTRYYGEYSYILFGVIFTNITLANMAASTGPSSMQGTIPFTANGIHINNSLIGNDILNNYVA